MADRRIDQLTESEEISDEDLFVIWKENISQTRSITMKTIIERINEIERHPHPDWENAVQITGAQLETGYVCPSDGMIVGYGYVNVDGVWNITVNSVIVSACWRATPSYSFLNVQCPVNKDDLVKSERSMNVCLISFVPFK